MRSSVAALILCMSSVTALAAGGAGVREACKGDVAALCQGIAPGGGRIRACLKTNKDKLSEGCRSAIAAMIEAKREAKRAGQQAAPSSAPPVMSPVVP
jgi:hypothetical protein